MNRLLSRTVAAALVASAAAVAGGCLAVAAGAAAAGAGTYIYFEGQLKSTLDASLERSFEASRAASKDLGFTEDKAKVDSFEGYINSEMADGTDIWINLKKLTDTSTEIHIRVGVFGDEAKSNAILEKIKQKL